MSPIRLPSLKTLTSKFGKLRSRKRLASRTERPIKYRSLQMDPLEERQLLSLAPADWHDILVNDPFTYGARNMFQFGDEMVFDPGTSSFYPKFMEQYGNPQSLTAKSLSADSDGDFIATWIRTDLVMQLQTDGSGNVIFDPLTGEPSYAPVQDFDTGGALIDQNVYARYFTDEVQRITLPQEVLLNGQAANSMITLQYGGHEIQKLSITATYRGFGLGQPNIQGQFEVEFAGNTALVVFNETDMAGNAARIEQALRGFPDVPAPTPQDPGRVFSSRHVTVWAVNPHEYIIDFGEETAGVSQPEITIPRNTVNFSSGFYPAVIPSTVREPILISNIPISPTNPKQTATAIQSYFAATTSDDIPIGPIDYPPNNLSPGAHGPRSAPENFRSALPNVTVIPVVGIPGVVDGTVFDVHFTGEAGKKDHPELVVSALTDELGNSLVASPDLDIQTVKQPSAEFRVNPVETDDPFTFSPDVFNQTNPVVAMDPDGDFVITWQSEVSDDESAGSVSDIYARRFSPVGLMDVFDPSSSDYDAELADNYGILTPGIRSLVSPDTEVVQLLSIDSTVGGPLTGEFRLRIGDRETKDIAFNSTNSSTLTAVANSIRVELEELGFDGVAVSRVSSTDPFQFRVKYKATFGTQLGKDQFELAYVPVVNPNTGLPLQANVNITDETSEYYTFLVNQDRVNPQFSPSVGVDFEGNFVIAWANGGQDLSYFNGVKMQRYNRYGERQGDQVLVNTENTAVHLDPHVQLSHDGNILVAWRFTSDPNYFIGNATGFSVVYKVYDPDGEVLLSQRGAVGAGPPAAAFDMNNNYIISSAHAAGGDTVPGTFSNASARMFQLFDSSGNVSGAEIRPTFRVNSAGDDDTPRWPLWQGSPDPALDADGDLVIAYEGYGPDASVNAGFTGQLFSELINSSRNEDLRVYFDPQSNAFGSFGSPAGNNGDIDGGIEQILINAQLAGANPEQIGRLSAILNSVAGLLRGEAYGALFSRWDADPQSQSITTLYSDSIANAYRDGHNDRWVIAIPRAATGGTFVIRLSRDGVSGFEDITVSPVFTNSVLNIAQTITAIDNALEGAARTGVEWLPETSYESSIDVRYVNSSEIDARALTNGWSWGTVGIDPTIHHVFEVTFQGEAHDDGFSLPVQTNSLSPEGVRPDLEVRLITNGNTGTTQQDVSIAAEPDGDFTMLWTQFEEFTSTGISNTNLYYRRFDEITDTAGPRLLDLANSQGDGVANGGFIQGYTQYVVLSFDENMLAVDPALDPNSILNPENFKVYRNDVEIPAGVAHVEFGLNMAANLAGKADPFGGTYELSDIPTNKWEAVLILDANGGLMDGVPALATGEYRIEALAPRTEAGMSGLRDASSSGNPLGYTGFVPGGVNMSRTFTVAIGDPDQEVDHAVAPNQKQRINATTNPENPGAVAADSDGQYVVAWTAYDVAEGRDRVWMQLYDADGTPADLPRLNASGQVVGVWTDAAPILPVTPYDVSDPAVAAAFQDFANDAQDHPSVAMDKDGDFVITWTNYRGGNADVYARRFDALGELIGVDSIGSPVFKAQVTEAFLVNTYTDDVQKWSDVAMDADGDFAITWSSYGQEDNGQNGTGYGIYARRYDSFGVPMAPEFQVNVTTAGSQQGSSIAMGAQGNFVIAWTSDQNGIGDDIIAREFNADGTPVAGPLAGEIRINDTVAGDQRYPDVAMSLDGANYIVTWTDTAADLSGSSVWAELSIPQPHRYVDPFPHIITGQHAFSISVGDNFEVQDVNVKIVDLFHQRLEDLEVILRSPDGTEVTLFNSLPRRLQTDGSRPAGNSLIDTVFDDEARGSVRITESDLGAVPPYTGSWVPQENLSAFEGEGSAGTWTLIVRDRENNNLTGFMNSLLPEGSWWLEISEVNASASSFRVNTTLSGNQMFSTVAMDHEGNFTVAWSGVGMQPNQSDTQGYGTFYQRYDNRATQISGETRANNNLPGDQWMPSIASDAVGNFVLVWTGPELGTSGQFVIDPATGLPRTSIYSYTSVNDAPQTDVVGPLVTDVLADGQRVLQNDVLQPLGGGITELKVLFDENLLTAGGSSGMHSVLNPQNWILSRNGSDIQGAIIQVTDYLGRASTDPNFDLWNPTTRKIEVVLKLDGNGLSQDRTPLAEGNYVLTIKDLVNDVSVFFDPDADPGSQLLVVGNPLDGNFDGLPGSDPINVGFGGYQHFFTVNGSPQTGAEFRINPDATRQREQRFSQVRGTGTGQEESTRSVAVDNDGDFVVVWSTAGQDFSFFNDVRGQIYTNLGERAGVELTVNATTTPGTTAFQVNPTVVMHNTDGSFVAAWDRAAAQTNGVVTNANIIARRFATGGTPLGGEFHVDDDAGYIDMARRRNRQVRRRAP